MTNYSDTLARNLRVERAKRNITQAQLAEIVGVSQASINSYENGYNTPNVDKLMSISDALNISPNDLLGWETN